MYTNFNDSELHTWNSTEIDMVFQEIKKQVVGQKL